MKGKEEREKRYNNIATWTLPEWTKQNTEEKRRYEEKEKRRYRTWNYAIRKVEFQSEEMNILDEKIEKRTLTTETGNSIVELICVLVQIYFLSYCNSSTI